MSGNLAYQDERSEELINGKLVTMPHHSVNHCLVYGNIRFIFMNYLKGKNSFAFGGFPVHLTDKDRFIPDVAVCDGSKIKPYEVDGAPDLVV